MTENREKLPTFSEIISKKGVQERWIGTYKWHRLGGSRQHMVHQQGKHRLWQQDGHTWNIVPTYTPSFRHPLTTVGRRRAPVRERIDRATVNEKTMRARIKKIKKRSLLESSWGGDPREKLLEGTKKKEKKGKEGETENGITELKEFKDPFVRGRALVPSVLRANHGFNHRHSAFLFFPLPPLDFHPALLSPCLATLRWPSKASRSQARDEDHGAYNRKEVKERFEERFEKEYFDD